MYSKLKRIVFLGTPKFAVPSLSMLIANGYGVVGVFTQPDKPVGRAQKLQASPVKRLALEHNIPVYQVNKICLPQGIALLDSLGPDLMISAAFGQIFSKRNLQTPTLGCINVHGSLLPKYRGASPIQQAIIDGENISGITTMFTDIGIDSGELLLQNEIEVLPDETAGELSERLADLGAQTLLNSLQALQNGTLERRPQIDSQATYCKMLTKESGHIDFTKSSKQVHNLVRGVDPWPGAYAMLNDAPIKIWKTRIVDAHDKGTGGEVICSDAKQGLIVATGDGEIEILEMQAAGCKRMETKVYLRGNRISTGKRFS